MTASYDRKGGRVYVGNSKGMIGVLDSVTLEVGHVCMHIY
jgi:hypothetical protein